MTHFSELFTANSLSILRNLKLAQSVENEVHVAPDIYFSWDSSQGTVEIALKSYPGHLADLWAKVTGMPSWLSFNLSLGNCAFKSGDVLGLIVELEGCEGHTFPIIVRSTQDGELSDTTLQDSLKGSEDRAVRTLLHTIAPHEALTGPKRYHTLIIPLPCRDFELDIRDVRLFIIPAARGLRSHPETVSSVG